MPSSSKKQSRFMAAVAHSPSFAKKVGVSQSVGKDFNTADKGKTFNKGGMMKMRKFAGEDESYVDDSGEEEYSAHQVDPNRRRFSDEEPTPKKAAPKKAAAKRNLDSAGSSKVSPAQEAVLRKRETDKASTAEAPASKKKSFGDFMEGVRSFKSTRGMAKGGMTKEPKGMMGKEVAFMKKKGAPASMIKHEKAEMGMGKGGMPMKDGKPAFLKKMMGGGMAKYAKGGEVPIPKLPIQPAGYRSFTTSEERDDAKAAQAYDNLKNSGIVKKAKGGGIESRGKTKGTIIGMAAGGSVSSASRRADGIAQRGKTRC
jgi:hypothetical protein